MSFDEEMEYGPDILTLQDEDGVDHEFEVLDTYEGEEEFLIAIEDEDEFDKVSAIFMDHLKDYYDFTEED